VRPFRQALGEERAKTNRKEKGMKETKKGENKRKTKDNTRGGIPFLLLLLPRRRRGR
jgi:hypothetical protein